MRIYVYIDGFNLYYAIKNTPYKWLDVKRFSENILPAKLDASIQKVRYFTARVSGSTDIGSPRRQQVYFNALKTVPEIQIHPGHFLSKTVWRPVIGLPIAEDVIHLDKPLFIKEGTYKVTEQDMSNERVLGVVKDWSKLSRTEKRVFYKRKQPVPDERSLVAEVHTMEEKGSDVNLAVHLLNDAWKGLFDMAVVVTNDTDLKEPISIVVKERQLPVAVVNPTINKTPAAGLKGAASTVWHVRKDHYLNSQFPETIHDGLSRPVEWV